MKKEIEKEPGETHSSLAMLGMTLVVLGIIFGVNDRLIGYSFMGAGVLLSVIDLLRKTKINNFKGV